jgi:hypothetical protein
MMRMGDRYCERIGRVGARDLRSGQQPSDHRMDLRLLGIAVADHRFLDQPRGIFADVDPGARGDHDDHAPRLAELQGRLRIGVDEDLLDRGAARTMLGEKRFELLPKRGKALRQGSGRIRFQLPIGDVLEAIAVSLDQSPAGGAETRIEAEDFQFPSPSGKRDEVASSLSPSPSGEGLGWGQRSGSERRESRMVRRTPSTFSITSVFENLSVVYPLLLSSKSRRRSCSGS